MCISSPDELLYSIGALALLFVLLACSFIGCCNGILWFTNGVHVFTGYCRNQVRFCPHVAHLLFVAVLYITTTLSFNQSDHLRMCAFSQSSRIHILCFFSDFKKHDFLRFFEMTSQKVVKKSLAQV